MWTHATNLSVPVISEALYVSLLEEPAGGTCTEVRKTSTMTRHAIDECKSGPPRRAAACPHFVDKQGTVFGTAADVLLGTGGCAGAGACAFVKGASPCRRACTPYPLRRGGHSWGSGDHAWARVKLLLLHNLILTTQSLLPLLHTCLDIL